MARQRTRTGPGLGPSSSPGPGGPTAPGGTLGGVVQRAMGVKPGTRVGGGLGDAKYLWILVALEVGALAYGRKIFKRRHGG